MLLDCDSIHSCLLVILVIVFTYYYFQLFKLIVIILDLQHFTRSQRVQLIIKHGESLVPDPFKLFKLGNIEKFAGLLHLLQDSVRLLRKNFLIKFLLLSNHHLFFAFFFNKFLKHFLLISARLKWTGQTFFLFLEVFHPVFDIQRGIDVIFDI